MVGGAGGPGSPRRPPGGAPVTRLVVGANCRLEGHHPSSGKPLSITLPNQELRTVGGAVWFGGAYLATKGEATVPLKGDLFAVAAKLGVEIP